MDLFNEPKEEPAPVDMEKHAGSRVSIEDGMGVIRIPLSEIHGLRVALNPCPCKMNKSISTDNIRQRLCAGLAKLQGMADRR